MANIKVKGVDKFVGSADIKVKDYKASDRNKVAEAIVDEILYLVGNSTEFTIHMDVFQKILTGKGRA